MVEKIELICMERWSKYDWMEGNESNVIECGRK